MSLRLDQVCYTWRAHLFPYRLNIASMVWGESSEAMVHYVNEIISHIDSALEPVYSVRWEEHNSRFHRRRLLFLRSSPYSESWNYPFEQLLPGTSRGSTRHYEVIYAGDAWGRHRPGGKRPRCRSSCTATLLVTAESQLTCLNSSSRLYRWGGQPSTKADDHLGPTGLRFTPWAQKIDGSPNGHYEAPSVSCFAARRSFWYGYG